MALSFLPISEICGLLLHIGPGDGVLCNITWGPLVLIARHLNICEKSSISLVAGT